MKRTLSVLASVLALCGLAISLLAQQPKPVAKTEAKPEAKVGVKIGDKVTASASCGTSTHSVILTWTASTSTDVTGYDVYRGTAAGGESTTPINSSLITTTTYTDSCVNASTTYYYTAQSYCSICSPTNSVSSNEVSAVLPANGAPAAPVMQTPTVQ